MKRILLILLLAAALAASPAAGQTMKSLGYNTTNGQVVYSGTNPLTFTNSLQFSTNSRAATRSNLGATTVGNSVFIATNLAAAATAIGLGSTNSVTFSQLTVSNGAITNPAISFGLLGTGFSASENPPTLRTIVGGSQLLSLFGGGFTVTPAATFSTNVTVTGNATLNGVANLAPAQTASSASSLMTRGLTDVRYNFARWYAANDILSGAQAVGANPLTTGNGVGSPTGAILVAVSNNNTKFMLPVDYRVGGTVKVVSYWTDRTATNGGTNGDIAVFALPFVVQPTTDSQTSGFVNGTQIKSTFTANYGGSERRYYVMEQTLNFGTITNINATNPSQLKFVELQRRGGDITDTSSSDIFLNGVHIYAEP